MAALLIMYALEVLIEMLLIAVELTKWIAGISSTTADVPEISLHLQKDVFLEQTKRPFPANKVKMKDFFDNDAMMPRKKEHKNI